MGNLKHKEKFHSESTSKETKEIDLSRSTRANRQHNDKEFLHGDFFSCFILSQISVRDFYAIRCTCKTWMRILDDERNWKEVAFKKYGMHPQIHENLATMHNESKKSWKEICNLRYFLDYAPKAYLEASLSITEKKKKEKQNKKHESTLLQPYDPQKYSV